MCCAAELWHYDTGNGVITSVRRRILVMESIRTGGLQLPRKVKPHDGQEEEVMDLVVYGKVMLALLQEDTAVTRPLHTSCFGDVHFLHTNGSKDLPEVLEEATCENSSGCMSRDLGDTWHQGLPMSPQWESELELGSDDNNEDEVEYEYEKDEDWICEELDMLLQWSKGLHQ